MARRSSSSSLGPFSSSHWLVEDCASAEAEVSECTAISPRAVDDPGIPTSRVSQTPLTPKGLANRLGAVNGSDVTTVAPYVTFGCSVLTTFGRPARKERFVDFRWSDWICPRKIGRGGPVKLGPHPPSALEREKALAGVMLFCRHSVTVAALNRAARVGKRFSNKTSSY